MIRIDDLIKIPFTPDLTQAGITYACHSMPHMFTRIGSIPESRLHRIISGAAVELAFRRYLGQQKITFNIKSAVPFTDPDRYDVSLGGHRCDIKSFLISHRSDITALQKDLGMTLAAPALVPLDQCFGDSFSENDILLFAFVTGQITGSLTEAQKREFGELPTYFIHTMPSAWARPHNWGSLGRISIKSEADETRTVEIGGQVKTMEFLACSLDLPSRTRCVLDPDFYSLAYLHIKNEPEARFGVFSPARGETYLINSDEWHNIWIYGMDIYLTGWISGSEFRRRAVKVTEGSRVFQFDHTRTKNLAVPISDLKPLTELFDRVREWQALN